jgi:ketosteroid isomerase-like protein
MPSLRRRTWFGICRDLRFLRRVLPRGRCRTSWFSSVRDAFGDVHYEVEKEGEFGDQVVQLVHLSGRGPGSQIPAEYRFAHAFTFRDGKIIRMDRYDDWASATEAVALSE